MPTLDLTASAPAPPATGLLQRLPRRLTLTLLELEHAAAAAGGAPLPFQVAAAGDADPLEGRLGTRRSSSEDEAFAAALASLHDPAETLPRRGLLVDDRLDEGVAGALGLLATPRVALDVDVTIGSTRARSWHRAAAGAVAMLGTVDGLVFELAWCGTDQWADELGRVAVLPSGTTQQMTVLPEQVTLPFELLDAAAEAAASGRADLLPVLADQHGSALGPDAASVLSALVTDARGRLRVLGADVSGDELTVVGVVSWLLLADGWHALRPQVVDGRQVVTVERVQPDRLGAELAAVLAEVQP